MEQKRLENVKFYHWGSRGRKFKSCQLISKYKTEASPVNINHRGFMPSVFGMEAIYFLYSSLFISILAISFPSGKISLTSQEPFAQTETEIAPFLKFRYLYSAQLPNHSFSFFENKASPFMPSVSTPI